jgi:hypothetical protein
MSMRGGVGRGTPLWPYIATVYVSLVATLASIANRDPNHLQVGTWVAAIVLCMPAFVPSLPAFYVLVGSALHLFDTDGGRSDWAFTTTYGVAFALMATANVLLLRAIAARAMSSRRRSRLQR